MSGPALRFFVDLVEQEGGAAEFRPESVLLLVGDRLRHLLGLPEELTVSEDPEVVDEEGGLLAVPGQPVISDAAETVLKHGDAGWRHLDWPSAPPPARERLQEAAREEFDVDHGRLDVDGQPASCWLPVLQVTALLDHRISLDERYEERAEVLVDGRSGGLLPPRIAESLAAKGSRPGLGTGCVHLEPDLPRAVAAAHAALDARAAGRQEALVRDSRGALQAECDRVDAYYRSVLESVTTRRDGASLERARLYDAQEEATRAEWSRRREETEAKFTGRHEVLPFRLHIIEVPAIRVPVIVRRGERRFDLHLDWLLPFSCYLPCRCPQCGAGEALVAGRDRLGCRGCLVSLIAPAPATEAPTTPPGPSPPSSDPVASLSTGIESYLPGLEPRPEGRAPEGRRPPSIVMPGPRRSEKDLPIDAAKREAASRVRMKRLEKVWRDVPYELWKAVARYERCRSVAPRSPLEALYRCYGPSGPAIALGLTPDARLLGMRSFMPKEVVEDIVSSDGTLQTSEGVVPFSLRWRMAGKSPSMVEVLPMRSPGGGRALPSLRHFDRRIADRLSASAPRPEGLGPVETLVWQHAVGEGLPLAVRCLALYWKVQGQRRVEQLSNRPLAVAVVALARRSSRMRGGADSVARRCGVDVAAVREAFEVLEVVLGAAEAHLW